ncbi:MAG: hypothetical protein L0H73_03410 [Nitrococcus sp.]|nr:hypothetical protein [Nitrococcus sp.]
MNERAVTFELSRTPLLTAASKYSAQFGANEMMVGDVIALEGEHIAGRPFLQPVMKSARRTAAPARRHKTY